MALSRVIQVAPNDSMLSLEQVTGVLRSLSSRPKDSRVLLLFTNQPLANGASVNTSIGTVRNFAAENGIQLSIVALPGAGGQGPAEALAEATPGGRVEYVLNATNRNDITRRIGPLLAPAFGARRFEFAALSEGRHTLTVTAPGATLPASVAFITAGRAVPIASLESNGGALTSGTEIRDATWIQARPAENVPIDSIEWSVDGRVTQVTSAPFAILLDPEQLGDGPHDVAARITSQGRVGPFFASSVLVPLDILRS